MPVLFGFLTRNGDEYILCALMCSCMRDAIVSDEHVSLSVGLQHLC